MRECLLSGPGHLSVGCFASGAKLALTLGSWLSSALPFWKMLCRVFFCPAAFHSEVTSSHFRIFERFDIAKSGKPSRREPPLVGGRSAEAEAAFAGEKPREGPFFSHPCEDAGGRGRGSAEITCSVGDRGLPRVGRGRPVSPRL